MISLLKKVLLKKTLLFALSTTIMLACLTSCIASKQAANDNSQTNTSETASNNLSTPEANTSAPQTPAPTPQDNYSQKGSDDKSGSVKNSETPVKLTYQDRQKIEECIRSYAKAAEKGDYETALKYCTPQMSSYIQKIIKDKSLCTNPTDVVIANKIPCKLVSITGYDNDKGPNYNLPKDSPTDHFDVIFEYADKDGKTQKCGGYVSAVNIDGEWYMDGFATGP